MSARDEIGGTLRDPHSRKVQTCSLPVTQSTKIEPMIKLMAAKTLGLKLPAIEIAARAVQSVAAIGARAAAAAGCAVVGVPHGARGDVGAGDIGGALPRHRPRRRHDRTLATTQARALGSAAP